ncbi:MAG TPA: hypothetical protein DG754_00820 [Bacteroidales bacterium]|nr:hypothetical protein [Bacteroidales bacterium]
MNAPAAIQIDFVQLETFRENSTLPASQNLGRLNSQSPRMAFATDKNHKANITNYFASLPHDATVQ